MPKLQTIQYRYVNLEKLWDRFHLKDMVVDVLRRTPASGGSAISSLARLRKKDLDQDGSFVVLNKLSLESTWDGPVFCGQLIHVKSGTDLPGISGSLDDDIPEFTLQSLSFEQQLQIVEGVLYFACVGNHVGVIEGARTRTRTLERYLTRLLQDAGELEAPRQVVLNAKLQGSISQVEALEIKPRKNMGPAGDDQKDVVGSDLTEGSGEGGTVLEVLKVLGWGPEELDQLQHNIPQGGWIEGFFKVVLKKSRNRKASIDRNLLEEALRDLAPGTVGLLGKGEKEKGGLIKLSERATIDTVGELLDPEDAMEKIMSALKRWSESGKIDCSFG